MRPNKRTTTGTFLKGLASLSLLCATLIAFGGMQPLLSAQTSGPASIKKWSLELQEVDDSDVALDPAFRAAIYENLLSELGKTGKFEQLFRSGDRRANSVPELLVLKISVRKFNPGSETERAVTTFAGATKIRVQSQLRTRDGQIVTNDLVDGNVHFLGDNLRATHNLAHNVANIIKKSTLPDPNMRLPKDVGTPSSIGDSNGASQI